MIVTPETKYEDFKDYEDVMTDESRARLIKSAQQQFKEYGRLAIAEFWGLQAGDYSLLGDTTDPTVLQYFWLKGFAEFLDAFAKACTALKIEPTTEQKQAENGTQQMTPEESMIIFVRGYFGLGSFSAAGEITINEYLLARKDAYNTAKIRRNFEQLQMTKLKQRKK